MNETTLTTEFYRAYPKIELHRHLEGSLRLETLLQVARQHGIDLLGTGQLRSLVQIHDKEPFTSANFLSKFETLRLFYRSPDIIERVTREAIADAAADNIRYLELRFTPVALSRAEGFSLEEVMDWVLMAAQNAAREFGVLTRLIASINRHESVRVAQKVAQLAVDRRGKGIVGLDLAGNEAGFSALPFAGVFQEAAQAGLNITIHAGEWGGAQNVSDAIRYLGAVRIGHGVRVLEDAAATDLARERACTFEVCLTSNHQSGVYPAIEKHPLPQMLAAGLNATIHTDDPSISQITLGHEYKTAREKLHLSAADLRNCVLQAARAAFLPPAERADLVQRIETEINMLANQT